MLEASLVKFCAPTLAGIKSASLFNTSSFPSMEKVYTDLAGLKDKLHRAGLHARIFPRPNHVSLFYLYRDKALQRDLAHPIAQRWLSKLGYPSGDVNTSLDALGLRLRESDTFPHEIGFFLAYPAHDVEAFMEKGPTSSLCKGYWCVYHDKEKCLRQFANFDYCQSCYRAHYAKHKKLDPLLIADTTLV